MSDIFDEFNKVLKKDLVPVLLKYFKDPNNKISDNLNDFLNDPQTLINNIFEKFSGNKDSFKNQGNYADIENVTDIDSSIDDEYDDLYKRLTLMEENMIQIEKILNEKIEKH
tara:strand:+ start:138 stop:473 length:336 start_codon:yes stop_codon:yes gene_type:complete